jgi:predicted N-acetyltransferase YhbS
VRLRSARSQVRFLPGALTERLDSLQIVQCGPERAQDVHRLTQAAFEPHRQLDPPSGAGRESLATVIEVLEAGGGAIAELAGRPVGCLRWRVDEDGDFRVGRLAVEPRLQRRGIGRALMLWAESEALRRGFDGVVVGVRIPLHGNLAFYRGLDYEVTGEHSHDGHERPTWLALRKRLSRD